MRIALFCSLCLGLLFQAYSAAKLPEVVIHLYSWDGTGRAAMLKWPYLLLTTCSFLANSIICLSSELLARKLPTSLVSFPHKTYWFTAKRKNYALQKMAQWVDLLGVILNTLLLFLFFLVLRANLDPSPQLAMKTLLAGLLVFLFILAVYGMSLSISFRPPKNAREDENKDME